MIQLDEDDKFVSCLNIPSNQLPEEILNYIERWCNPDFKDQIDDLQEDMYALNELYDSSKIINTYPDIVADIKQLMEKYNCAYFRIIK